MARVARQAVVRTYKVTRHTTHVCIHHVVARRVLNQDGFLNSSRRIESIPNVEEFIQVRAVLPNSMSFRVLSCFEQTSLVFS